MFCFVITVSPAAYSNKKPMPGTQPDSRKQKEDKPMGWLWFLLGLWIGGGLGVLTQALLQARRVRQWQQRLQQLEQQKR